MSGIEVNVTVEADLNKKVEELSLTTDSTNNEESVLPGDQNKDHEALGNQNDLPDNPVTVFTDPVNFNIKHPLHNAWTFWYDSPNKKKSASSWSQNLKNLVTIDTVEDFWGVFNNLIKADELANGANYYLFREGIRPEWEDEANANGGKWVIQFKKDKKRDVHELWMFTLLACIGESFGFDDELCGAIFSARRDFLRITVWTRTCTNETVATSIGKTLKESLGSPREKLEFTPHSDIKPNFNTPTDLTKSIKKK